MNQIQHVPYSDEIRQLMRKKSGILFSAHRRKDDGIFDEATAMFGEAGELKSRLPVYWKMIHNTPKMP